VTSALCRLAALALLVLAATSCQAKEESPVLERDLVEPGALHVCTDPTRPPMQYRGSDGVLRGFEVDLLGEIADELDLRPVWVDVKRGAIVGALAEGRCDVIASSLDVRWEEQEAIREIEYLSVPMSLLVRDGADAPLAVGLCGRRIGAFPGTQEAKRLAVYSEACRRDDRPTIEIVVVTGREDALNRLRGSRIDGLLDDLPTNAWYVQRQTDRFDDGGAVSIEDVHYALGYGKDRTSVYLGLRAALFTLYEDGTFAELMERWGLDRKGVRGLPLYS
jgi:polar amino acid transport system substrate-binding protein